MTCGGCFGGTVQSHEYCFFEMACNFQRYNTGYLLSNSVTFTRQRGTEVHDEALRHFIIVTVGLIILMSARLSVLTCQFFAQIVLKYTSSQALLLIIPYF